MTRKIIFSRAILYSDCSGVETGVEFDPTYRLGRDDDASYVHVKGVGDAIPVRVAHIPQIIEWLQGVAELDEEFRASREGGAS